MNMLPKFNCCLGGGKMLRMPLFAACSTVPPTGLSKSPKNVPNNTGGGKKNPDLDEAASTTTYSVRRRRHIQSSGRRGLIKLLW